MSKETFLCHIFVIGFVQGVGFRYFTKEAAEKFSIKGWVKNLKTGQVEILAQSKKSDIEKFIEMVKKGPTFAKVKEIKVEWLKEYQNKKFEDFQIIY